jgi:hypothetical protein
LPTLGDAGVEQAGNVRMRQPRQYAAFMPEPIRAFAHEQAQIEELDRGESFEAPIAAFRQPNDAHAAFPERPLQRVVADDSSSQGRRAGEIDGRPFQKILGEDGRALSEQGRDVSGEGWVLVPQLRKQGFPPRFVCIQQFIEQRTDNTPTRGVELTQELPSKGRTGHSVDRRCRPEDDRRRGGARYCGAKELCRAFGQTGGPT